MCESHPFFRRVGQLPSDGFQISMVSLIQWTLMTPCQSISYFLSLFSFFFKKKNQACIKWPIILLCFSQNSKLPATPLFFSCSGVDTVTWFYWGCATTGQISSSRIHDDHLQTNYSSVHPTCRFPSVNSAIHSLLWLPSSNLWLPPPSLLSSGLQPCLLLHREHWVHYRAISTSHYPAQRPTHLPPVSWPFLPPTSQVCLVPMPQNPSSITSGNLHENPPPFLPAPS